MAAVQSTVPVYPIGVVQRLTGLSARQIRYYEKEGLLSPSRTRGNRRLYSPAEVQRLRQVKSLLAQGLNLEGVKAYLEAQGREAGGRAEPAAEISPVSVGAAGPAASEESSALSPGRGAEGLEEREVRHSAIFRQARGRRLSSLFPVDHQDELVRWLESERRPEGNRDKG